jgi:hypothetical protein
MFVAKGPQAVLEVGCSTGHRLAALCWCVYEYFPETKATDMARDPSSGQITDAILRAGFDHVACGIACRFAQTRFGRAIFEGPEL